MNKSKNVTKAFLLWSWILGVGIGILPMRLGGFVVLNQVGLLGKLSPGPLCITHVHYTARKLSFFC